MPPIKNKIPTDIQFYSPKDEEFIGLMAEAKKLLGKVKLPSNLASQTAVRSLTTIALCPHKMADEAAHIQVFERLFVRFPDETLDILLRLRELAAKQRVKQSNDRQNALQTQAGLVREFLARTRFVYRKKGKWISAPSSDDFLTDRKALKSGVEKIATADLQEKQIADYLSRNGMTVTVGSVKMARRSLLAKVGQQKGQHIGFFRFLHL